MTNLLSEKEISITVSVEFDFSKSLCGIYLIQNKINNKKYVGSSRNKISNKLTGLTRNSEQRNRISLGHKGQIVSEKTRNKMSAAHLGTKQTLERAMKAGATHKKPIEQFSLDGKLIKTWAGKRDAANALNILESAIGNCVKGTTKRAGNFRWRYKIT